MNGKGPVTIPKCMYPILKKKYLGKNWMDFNKLKLNESKTETHVPCPKDTQQLFGFFFFFWFNTMAFNCQLMIDAQ